MLDYSKGYRNIYYNGRTRSITLWGWDEHGNRKDIIDRYSPYLYVEANRQQDATSIFGTPLKKLEFNNSSSRRQFIDRHHNGRVFGSLAPEQQYLIDHFRHIPSEQLTSQPIRTFFFDIEVHSPDKFPEAHLAEQPINVITIYDTLTSTFHTWGTQAFDKHRLNQVLEQQGIDTIESVNVKYTACGSEVSLLREFLTFWINNYPDLIVGWNSDQFDIPYIINRLTNLFGEDAARSLSPVNYLRAKEDSRNIFGQLYTKWQIQGISGLDYLELYDVFSRGDAESRKLGVVGTSELGVNKIQHTAGDLVTLADTDWDLFVAYNIQDVNLLVLLDKKLGFVNLARFVTTKGLTKMDNALGKIAIVAGGLTAEAYNQGVVFPTFRNDADDREEYPGGYVREPIPGLYEDIVSYDANSLYPNTIISLNLSPETKVGKIVSQTDDGVVLRLRSGATKELTTAQLDTLIDKGQLARSSAGVLYSQKIKGIIPSFIDSLYQERVDMVAKKAECNKLISELDDNDPRIQDLQSQADRADILSYTTKILLNSIYGNFASLASPLFDVDNAASITLTGQNVVKQAAIEADNWAREQFPYLGDEGITKYGDTDSLYVSLQSLRGDDKIVKDNKVVRKDIVDTLGHEINDRVTAWAKKELNTVDPRYVFKRETVCDAGIFMKKKKYVIRMIENDGIPCDPKIKPVGIEIARSSYSANIKNILRHLVGVIFEQRTQLAISDAVLDAHKTFTELAIDDMAFRASLGSASFTKHTQLFRSIEYGMPKGCPPHMTGSLVYNDLVDKMGLTNSRIAITPGDKIMWMYVDDNAHGIKTIAWPEDYPKEFGLAPNVDLMFSKVVRPLIQRLCAAVGWTLPNTTAPMNSTLEQLFG